VNIARAPISSTSFARRQPLRRRSSITPSSSCFSGSWRVSPRSFPGCRVYFSSRVRPGSLRPVQVGCGPPTDDSQHGGRLVRRRIPSRARTVTHTRPSATAIARGRFAATIDLTSALARYLRSPAERPQRWQGLADPDPRGSRIGRSSGTRNARPARRAARRGDRRGDARASPAARARAADREPAIPDARCHDSIVARTR
jgi:hypothetical protein